METVFEHKITMEELKSLLGHCPNRDYLVQTFKKQNSHYHMIYDLRNDEKMAQKYLARYQTLAINFLLS
ncbi:MAG: hypothetical protein J6I79_03185 [Paludibacteraceae bacterium]|nr:hypothetical protein [Paludibacteraceae bacterium]